MSLEDAISKAENHHQRANATRELPNEFGSEGLTWLGDRGTLTVDMGADFRGDSTSVWDDVIRKHTPFDPSQVRVVEPVGWKQWTDGSDGEPNYWFHLKLVSAERSSDAAAVDVDALADRVRMRRPRKVREVADGHHLHVNLADWQAGKKAGGGLEALGLRIEHLADSVVDIFREQRKLGRPIHTLHLNGLGDLRESCRGHYTGQHFQVEGNFRTQERFIRRSVLELIDFWLPEVAVVEVHAVGGNHGEQRGDNGADTDTADNVDVALFEQVADALAMNPDRYSNVAFQLPEGDLSVTYRHGDLIVGLAHGHQAPGKDIAKWWQGQALGRQPMMHADILITGHYHHFVAKMVGGNRQWFQCPALEGPGGSDWWRQRSGDESPSGTLTFVTDGTWWSDLRLVQPGI